MNRTKAHTVETVVIGASAGAFQALSELLSELPSDFKLAVAIVVHLRADAKQEWINLIGEKIKLPMKEAEDKEPVLPGYIYTAPTNYHLTIEEDKTFSLSLEERVNFARPSIDVLFESASYTYGPNLAGIVLTGANNDGAMGMKSIYDRGGLTIVQDPSEAEFGEMPASVLEATAVHHILKLQDISKVLQEISDHKKQK